MTKNNSIILFNQKEVRRHFDSEKELWYFSVIDVIEVLTNNKRPRKYWNDLKKKLSFEGSQLSAKIGQLRMRSSDGKLYKNRCFRYRKYIKTNTISTIAPKQNLLNYGWHK